MTTPLLGLIFARINFREDLFSRIAIFIFLEDLFSRISSELKFREDLFSRIVEFQKFHTVSRTFLFEIFEISYEINFHEDVFSRIPSPQKFREDLFS